MGKQKKEFAFISCEQLGKPSPSLVDFEILPKPSLDIYTAFIKGRGPIFLPTGKNVEDALYRFGRGCVERTLRHWPWCPDVVEQWFDGYGRIQKNAKLVAGFANQAYWTYQSVDCTTPHKNWKMAAGVARAAYLALWKDFSLECSAGPPTNNFLDEDGIWFAQQIAHLTQEVEVMAGKSKTEIGEERAAWLLHFIRQG